MTDRILLVALILTMTGCGKISDELSTGIDVLGGDWNKFVLAAVAILKETK